MAIHSDTAEREISVIEDARIRPMMGINVLESLPHPRIPYSLVDPFILVHEAAVPITAESASLDTEHPHRGFDNLWYLVSGSASTGHITGPGGAMERARLRAGSLLKIRTGRGVRHAEGIGADEVREGKSGTEMRGVLFWVNLARKDKRVAPTAQVLESEDVPVRHEGDAIVRVLVGEGSPVELGTPGLILDVELPQGGAFSTPGPVGLQGLCLRAGGRGRSRRQSTASEPLADRRSRTGSRGDRERCATRDAFPAHGREAIRRDACVQRTVCGLTAAKAKHARRRAIY